MSDLKQVIEESFQQYSGAVLQSRALVDVRDCIKPSARQMFYCMNYEKMDSHHDFKKTLRAIAAGMRVYIHGDSSAEGIIMRASQPFAMRYPLVEVEGSNGNVIESSNWSAPRYTASRLSPISDALFADITKDTIAEWRDNYDDTFPYPAVLPSKGFYNLVNGTYGIGIGVSASIPQFNISELNKALITLIKNPEASYDEIYCAPDFATGGVLINKDQVKESLKVGHGKGCVLRAKFNYDEKSRTLTAHEIPYGVYTNTICKELEEIVNGEDNPGIDRFNDLTGEEPNIKIYLSRKADKDFIIKFLYKNTSLQASYGINMTMLDNGRFPKVFGWADILKAHLAHEKEVYIRGYKFDLNKIEHRIKIISAIIKAIENVEEVIATIKSAESTADANNKLQKLLNIDEEQAKAILDIKLAKLARLSVQEYKDELVDLIKEQNRITKILNSEELLNAEMIKGYEVVANRYGDSRRTELTQINDLDEPKEEVYVEPEKVVVQLTQSGLIKRIPTASFKPQNRNTKGVKSTDEILLNSVDTNTVDTLLLFSTSGQMYKLLVDKIPQGTNSSKGASLRSLGINDTISTIYPLSRGNSLTHALFVTKNGLGKRVLLDDLSKTRNSALNVTKLREGDSLISVSLVKDEDVLFITKMGQVVRVSSKEISCQTRVGTGIKAVGLKKGDEVIAALPIRDKSLYLALFSELGYGKKLPVEEFKPQAKGGKGVQGYKVLKSSGNVAAAILVEETDNVLISGNTNSVCIVVSDIPEASRVARGNIMIKDNQIQKVSKV